MDTTFIRHGGESPTPDKTDKPPPIVITATKILMQLQHIIKGVVK
jgi:hypothetical protein